jgi:ATP-dependent RNA helicase MSS116, mitochondrial
MAAWLAETPLIDCTMALFPSLTQGPVPPHQPMPCREQAAWLGFYRTCSYVSWARTASASETLVATGNRWAALLGYGPEPPEMDAQTVGKMGLRGVPGLRVVRGLIAEKRARRNSGGGGDGAGRPASAAGPGPQQQQARGSAGRGGSAGGGGPSRPVSAVGGGQERRGSGRRGGGGGGGQGRGGSGRGGGHRAY